MTQTKISLNFEVTLMSDRLLSRSDVRSAIIRAFGYPLDSNFRWSSTGPLPHSDNGSVGLVIDTPRAKETVKAAKVSMFGLLNDFGSSEDIEALKMWFDLACSSSISAHFMMSPVMHIEVNDTDIIDYPWSFNNRYTKWGFQDKDWDIGKKYDFVSGMSYVRRKYCKSDSHIV